jgi:NAD(P)-dependent dehydrogenase (short-subunit alcohol dehydrogenase family)
VHELAQRGARVVFTARDVDAGDAVVAEVRAATGNQDVQHRRLHLDDLSSVRDVASSLRDDLERLDVLINNAGVVVAERRLTAQGHELTIGVNHFGHFLLVEELRDLMVASAPARIIVVASDAHKAVRKGLDFEDMHATAGRFGTVRGLRAYAHSKLANVLHTRELARRLDGTGVTANCVHPGPVKTRLGRDTEATRLGEAVLWPVIGLFMRSPERGARTSVWAATAPELDGVTGAYLRDSKLSTPARVAQDDVAAARLWEVSEALVGRG